jgi:hypothetical protein
VTFNTLNAKTGWREVEIDRGSSDQTCPVHALEQWLHFAKVGFGLLFVRTSRDGTKALDARLSDKHVARLIKQTVLDAGIRSELPEKSASPCSQAIVCGLVWLRALTSTSPMSRNNSGMPRLR